MKARFDAPARSAPGALRTTLPIGCANDYAQLQAKASGSPADVKVAFDLFVTTRLQPAVALNVVGASYDTAVGV